MLVNGGFGIQGAEERDCVGGCGVVLKWRWFFASGGRGMLGFDGGFGFRRGSRDIRF